MILAALALLIMSGALAALVTVQVIFWTKTQPVNSFWLEETELRRSATASSRPVGETLHATGPRAISGSVRNIASRAGGNARPIPADPRGRPVEAWRGSPCYLFR